ncbi:WD40 repeat domain-containing protein [Streptomyces atratus]|uniref:WD40 repeat domain-containing protein n=1 Tax=Streptomyces atratus TaxID=1893 RepID=UPI0036C479FF
MWDLATRQQIGEPLTGHTSTVLAVATTVVNARLVAITGSEDRTVRVWDLTTGQPDGQKLVFPAPVGTVAVSPDGRLVVGFGCEVAVLSRC